MRDWLRAVGVSAVVVLAIGWASLASAHKATSHFLNLSGVFFSSNNAIAATANTRLGS
jgi:hypothetical protein